MRGYCWVKFQITFSSLDISLFFCFILLVALVSFNISYLKNFFDVRQIFLAQISIGKLPCKWHKSDIACIVSCVLLSSKRWYPPTPLGQPMGIWLLSVPGGGKFEYKFSSMFSTANFFYLLKQRCCKVKNSLPSLLQKVVVKNLGIQRNQSSKVQMCRGEEGYVYALNWLMHHVTL